MALRAGYYGLKKKFIDKVNKWDQLVFPRSEQAVLGAVNLFDISKAVNGNLKVVNNTLENLATDTRSANFWVGIRKGTTPVQTLLTLQNLPSVGHYEFSFTIPNNVDYDNLYIGHNGANNDNKCSYPFNRFGTFYISFDATGVDVSTVGGYILTNVQIALSANAPYVPYAMTNKELTVSATDQKTVINAIISAATGAADFAAFKTAMGAIMPVTRSYQIEGTTEPDSRSIEEPVVEKKTTRKKSTAKAETTEEV